MVNTSPNSKARCTYELIKQVSIYSIVLSTLLSITITPKVLAKTFSSPLVFPLYY